MTTTPLVTCTRCGAASSGNFCSSCGAPLGATTCLACGTSLAPGAKFCHKCGAAAGDTIPSRAAARDPGATAANPSRERTAWIVAALLVLVIVAGVLYSANRRAAPAAPVMANAGNAGNAVSGIADSPGTGCAPTGPAPDISKLTARERFVRLVDRINGYLEKSDTACVIQFTPMALGAYANLTDADRDVDTRYHTAMLEAQVGMLPNASALADTIMTVSPDNLFGYYIRAMVAEFAGDSAKATAARAGFRSHYDAELKKNRPEYAEHRPFLEQYRKGDGAN